MQSNHLLLGFFSATKPCFLLQPFPTVNILLLPSPLQFQWRRGRSQMKLKGWSQWLIVVMRTEQSCQKWWVLRTRWHALLLKWDTCPSFSITYNCGVLYCPADYECWWLCYNAGILDACLLVCSCWATSSGKYWRFWAFLPSPIPAEQTLFVTCPPWWKSD